MNELDRKNNNYWTWGVFYKNPNDPSIWVEKKSGFGWTVNFAHKISYFIVALIVGMPLWILLALALMD
ncbi:MAG TPA: DUF5808 domain-containing protein [Pedobacter sp.]|uniref:DUF5808 domain-containing protein n=1 Tax=Pedobacter sp. TaxID=1411316 RepID=UPI002CC963DD|nr:DUF5808 domain-containing protein [Pedobacter sp.]HMI05206.1 DUF5808 domain-containing protein [Pedobacter sp.]